MNRFADYGYSGVYQQWWKWALEDIPETYPMGIQLSMDHEKYHCPWDNRLNEERGKTYIPKLKRPRTGSGI